MVAESKQPRIPYGVLVWRKRQWRILFTSIFVLFAFNNLWQSKRTESSFAAQLRVSFSNSPMQSSENETNWKITTELLLHTNLKAAMTNLGEGTQIGNTTTTASYRSIVINRDSAYARTDLLNIRHLPETFEIEIHLKPRYQRRCQNPVFLGRLSGWSLSIIEFGTKDSNVFSGSGRTAEHGGDVVIGRYNPLQIPISGKYYIEILLLNCEAPNAENGEDLKQICMEDTTNSTNRITAGDGEAWIQITLEGDDSSATRNPRSSNLSSSIGGSWIHAHLHGALDPQEKREGTSKENFRMEGTELPNDYTPEAVFTRYQPKGCMVSNRNFKSNKNTTVCRTAVDRTRFSPYHFHWDRDHPSLSKLNKATLQILPREYHHDSNASREERPHVCFVGSSHARVLWKKCESLMDRTRKYRNQRQGQISPLSVTLNCSYMKVKYPFQIQNDCPIEMDPQDCSMRRPSPNSTGQRWVLDNIVNPRCTHVVLALFQWPFSFAQHLQELSFQNWKAQITNVLQIMFQYSHRIEHDTESIVDDSSIKFRKFYPKIILRSVHTNGLKEHISSCPPKDFRSPINAKICNDILRDITTDASSARNKVSFLDTSFITGPVWDSAEDWSHFNNDEGTHELKYILHEILSDEYDFE